VHPYTYNLLVFGLVGLQRRSAWDSCSTCDNEVKPQNKPNVN
jgi:hypothetical protein